MNENENRKIKVSWKLGSSFQNDVILNEPVSCVVRYRVMYSLIVFTYIKSLKVYKIKLDVFLFFCPKKFKKKI